MACDVKKKICRVKEFLFARLNSYLFISAQATSSEYLYIIIYSNLICKNKLYFRIANTGLVLFPIGFLSIYFLRH